MTTLFGSCNCKAVTFKVHGPLPGIAGCHCSQCRKQSGHFWASSRAEEAKFDINGEVRWYEASPKAKRGFCPNCGTFLFWKAHDETELSFSAGVIDGPTGLQLLRHIFVADKGDYYHITDNLPQRAQ